MIMVSHLMKDFRQFPCKCGSKNCIGYIVREGSRWRVRKIKNKKMKKILFVSARNPYSGRYSGDVIRSLKLIDLLKKKYHLDVICLKKTI